MKLKNGFGIFVAMLLLAFVAMQAFTPPPGDRYAYGKRQAVTLLSADTVVVSPNNLTLTYATMGLSTNVVVNVDVGNSIVGDRIILDLTADALDRTLIFNDNITGISEIVTATKNELMEFIYNGTVFKEVAEMAVD